MIAYEDFKKPDCYMNKNYSERGVSLIKFTLDYFK